MFVGDFEYVFLRFRKIQGRARNRLEAQERSQKAPEEIQKLKERASKMDPSYMTCLANFENSAGTLLQPEIN